MSNSDVWSACIGIDSIKLFSDKHVGLGLVGVEHVDSDTILFGAIDGIQDLEERRDA